MSNGKPGAEASPRRPAERQPRGKTKRTSRTRGSKPAHAPELQQLLHDLKMHQLELEMQNQELRRTQGELERSLANYADFYDFTPAGYLTLKPDSTIVQANLTTASLLGIDRARLLKRRFVMFVAADARPAFFVLLARVFESKIPEVNEVSLSIKGKPPITVQFQAFVPESGQECRVVLTDITGRKQMEKLLAESEEKFSQLFRLNPDAINLNRLADGVYLDINEGFTAILGYTREEVMERSSRTSDLGLWVNNQDRKRLLMQLKAHGSVAGFEAPFRCKDGRVIQGLMSARLLRINGEACILSISRDITERKRAEEALQESEGRYRGLFEAESDAILLVDQETHAILEANTAALKMYGCGREELQGRKITEISAEPDATRQTMASRTTSIPLRWHRKQDGRIFPVEIRINYFDYVGRQTYVAAIRDITERKRAEEALHESELFARSILNALTAHIAVLDAQGVIVAVNQGWSQFAQENGGNGSTAFLGANYLAVCEARLRDGKDKNVAAALQGLRAVMKGERDEFSLEYTCHAPTQERWFALQVTRFSSGGETRLVATHEDITKRKQLEEALCRNQALLESVTEGTSDAVFVKDTQGRYLMLNSAASRFVGKPKAEVLGQDDTALFPPDEAQVVMEGDRKVMASGTTQTYDEHVTAGGARHTFLSTKGPVRDAEGQVVGLFGIARDITQRKFVEEALRRSRQRLALHVLQTPLAVIEFGLDGLIRGWNPAAVTMFGYSRQEALGQHWSLLLPDATRESAKGAWSAIANSRGGSQFTSRNRTRNGRIIICEWFYTTLTDPQGQAIGVASQVMDVTEREQAQEALRQSQTELKTIYENAPTMLCVLDASRRVIYANRAFAEFVGQSAEELSLERIGSVIGCLQALDDPQGCGQGPQCVHCAVRLAMMDALATGRSHRAIEYRNMALYHGRPQDSVFLISVAPIRMTGHTNLLLCFEDITEREQAQEVLHQLSAGLVQVQEEERRRVARELHDTVAQSLTALSLNLGLLESHAAALDPNLQLLLAESQELADQCGTELRTSSYLLYPPILDQLGLGGAVRDHADAFARRSGLRVDLELPPDLVRLPRETELALFRVLQEALANVQHHSGSKTASICVTQTAGEIRLEVRDHGRGMAPERGLPIRLERLKSTQAPEGSSDAQSGLAIRPLEAASKGTVRGLGIPGMKERMRQLGGRLELRSNENGTMVLAILPRPREIPRV